MKKLIYNTNKMEIKYQNKTKKFWNLYIDFLNQLINTKHDKEEEFLIKSLYTWFFDKGIISVQFVLNKLKQKDQEKVLGFVNLYSYILKNSEDDMWNLIDQLYYIPERFRRDFTDCKI